MRPSLETLEHSARAHMREQSLTSASTTRGLKIIPALPHGFDDIKLAPDNSSVTPNSSAIIRGIIADNEEQTLIH